MVDVPEQSNGKDQSLNADYPDSARTRALIKASFVAIGVDVSLMLLKYLLSVLTGSAVLAADALHSGGDLAVSVTVLISIVVNYGFRKNVWAKKAEGLVALLISVLLIFGSLSVLWGVVKNVPERFTLTVGIPLVVAILGISIACVVAFAMSRFKQGIGEKYSSIAFTAEGMHTRSDFFTSFGVWVTLLLGYFGIHIERFMTLVIGLIVLRIGLKLLYKALEFFHIPEALTWTPTEPILGGISNRIKRYWQTLVSFYSKARQPLRSITFFREEWILDRRRSLLAVNVILIILLYFGTGFYSILPYQTGVELLFGKVIEKNSPGMHFHAPPPFGKVIRVDTGVTARVESGFRTNWDFLGQEPEAYLWEYMHAQGRYAKVFNEAIAMTGDENLVDGNFICYYRIADPVQYALNNENTHEILRSLFVHETHTAVGHYHLDTLLTLGREAVQEELTLNMRTAVEELPLGVDILQVNMQEAHPPIEVVPQYRAVASAREEKNEIIHRANAYTNDLLPRSRGRSQAKVLDSKAFSSEQSLVSAGRSEQFLLTQRNFSQYRSVQEERMRWETAEKALEGRAIYILPRDAKHRIYTSDMKPEVDE